MTSISKAEAQRRLPVGSEWEFEMCGRINAKHLTGPNAGKQRDRDERITRRRISKHLRNEIQTEILSGPRIHETSHLSLVNVAVWCVQGEIGFMRDAPDHEDDNETFLKVRPLVHEWVMPDWMERFRDFIRNTGGNTVEDLMNDTDSNSQNNHIRWAMKVSVADQVKLLGVLVAAGELVAEDHELVTPEFCEAQGLKRCGDMVMWETDVRGLFNLTVMKDDQRGTDRYVVLLTGCGPESEVNLGAVTQRQFRALMQARKVVPLPVPQV